MKSNTPREYMKRQKKIDTYKVNEKKKQQEKKMMK